MTTKIAICLRLDNFTHKHLIEQAKKKGITKTELAKECFINGFGRDKYYRLLKQEKQNAGQD